MYYVIVIENACAILYMYQRGWQNTEIDQFWFNDITTTR